MHWDENYDLANNHILLLLPFIQLFGIWNLSISVNALRVSSDWSLFQPNRTKLYDPGCWLCGWLLNGKQNVINWLFLEFFTPKYVFLTINSFLNINL